MAVRTITIPSTATEQQNQQQNLSEAGDKTQSRSFKDTYANGATWLNSLQNGDVLNGWVLKSATISRSPGDMGIVTLNLAPNDIEGEGEQSEQVALDETWTLKAVRNDKSLLAYCGPSAENPSRTDIEAWLKEPDGTTASLMKYKKSDGTEVELSSTSQALAAKYLAGHESVMRFYPMLTKKRTYSTEPASVYENLACINTPSVSSIYGTQGATGSKAKKVKAPGNISSIISAHSWLKCQDDLEQTADGKFVRVESWIGAKTGEESWDANFYGTDNTRWKIPYSDSTPSST